MDKKAVLQDIRVLDFALQDASLYLDLHPQEEEALCFYRSVKKQLVLHEKEYERNFAMLNNRSVFSNEYAEYVYSPWPWEKVKEDC